MLVGGAGRASADGIHHDQSTPARLQSAQSSRHVRRRHHRPVRHQGIGPEDKQVVGAVDIGHRDGEAGAEHQRGGRLLGELVDRARGEPVDSAEGPQEGRQVERARHVVDVGVAEEDPDGVGSVLRDHLGETDANDLERLIPRRGHEIAGVRVADERRAEAIGVGVQLADQRPLGADEAVAEDVVGVAADAGDGAVLDRDDESAGGLAQGTDVEMFAHSGDTSPTTIRGWTPWRFSIDPPPASQVPWRRSARTSGTRRRGTRVKMCRRWWTTSSAAIGWRPPS